MRSCPVPRLVQLRALPPPPPPRVPDVSLNICLPYRTNGTSRRGAVLAPRRSLSQALAHRYLQLFIQKGMHRFCNREPEKSLGERDDSTSKLSRSGVSWRHSQASWESTDPSYPSNSRPALRGARVCDTNPHQLVALVVDTCWGSNPIASPSRASS